MNQVEHGVESQFSKRTADFSTEESSKLFKRASQVIPGGVNSPVRAFGSVERDPIFVKKAKGATLWDVDGNDYIDYIGSWGPAILGHASEIASEGVLEQMSYGTTYGLPTEIEINMSEKLIQALPSMEMVRMVSSGTEATMSALRLARGYTGRSYCVKFEGCYHGHADQLLVKTGSGALTLGIPTSAGVSKESASQTLVASYNDLNSVRSLFEQYPEDIAAIIVEPISGNMGVVPPAIEFLQGLRAMCTRYGALLIFDEVITGFRVGFGGAQGLYGIVPDLTCLGKIIGGGLPVGAYGGRRDIMEKVAPLGAVYQAGTLSGNPVAMRMGLNVLNHLENHPEIYAHLEQLAIRLQQGFEENIQKYKIEATVNRVKSMVSIFFTNGPVTSYQEVMQSDSNAYGKYFRGMLERGILLPPAQFEAMFLSAAHTTTMIEDTIRAQADIFANW